MSSEPEDPIQHNHSDEEKGQGGHQRRASAAALLEAFARQYERDREANRRSEKYRTIREYITIIGLFLAAGFALLQWRELRSTDRSIAEQAKAARDQLTVMQGQLDSMEADQRAWVYVESAEPMHDLIFADGRAVVTVKFQLKNTGRTPARFATVTGEFIMRGRSAEDVKKGWDNCDQERMKPEDKLLAGTAVFPGQEIPQAMWFAMPKEKVALWTADYAKASSEKVPFTIVPLIVGCVDYIFEKTNRHHQTRFVYEVDKKGPDALTFLAIDPAAGNVPLSSVALAKNPGLADNPD